MKFKFNILKKFKKKSKRELREEFLIKEFEEGNVIRLENIKETHNYSNKFVENNKI